LFDIEKILRILPHRYPFLLVDKVLALEQGRSIVAIKNVTYDEPFFQGHFPRRRVMPGVLVVEALAQAGGILLFHSLPDPESKLVFLSKIENMKFRRPVVPGDQMRLEAEVLKFKHGFYRVRARAYVDEEVVTEGDIMASLMDLEDLNG
jgi:beta-hydroxyacyl-ACP dehydratase FabZ